VEVGVAPLAARVVEVGCERVGLVLTSVIVRYISLESVPRQGVAGWPRRYVFVVYYVAFNFDTRCGWFDSTDTTPVRVVSIIMFLKFRQPHSGGAHGM
jgi:hypothetical protein